MINKEHKMIFIHHPKCGGSSIRKLLDFRPDRRFPIGTPQHSGHWYIQDILKRNPWAKDYFSFSFIRNPFAIEISRYFYIKWWRHHPYHKIAKENEFKDFLKKSNNEIRNFSRMRIDNKVAVDYVGRIETFEKDLSFLCNKANIPLVDIPKENSRTPNHYTEYYDDETINIVSEFYKQDLEEFGYKFGD